MEIKCAHNEVKDIDLLVPNPRNPNKHPDEQIKLLAKIMNHQGWRSPIVVSKRSGFITKGHGRLMAAKINGWSQAPVDMQDYATEADEYADMVADNKIAELAETDMLMVNADASQYPELDLDLLGIPEFQLTPIDTLEPGCDEDEIPEHVEPKTKLGDIYQLGNHRLMCGDSTSIDAVEKLMNGEKADMVFTDPPYGINESASKRSTRETNSIAKSNSHLKEFKDDSTSYAVDAFNHCQAMKIPVQIWFGANYYCHNIPETNNWLVWDKRLEDKQSDNNSDAELAWVQDGRSSVRIFRHLWKGLIKGSEHGSRRVHPTQKPIALSEWCINKYEPKSVLDLFGGSGSTLIACEKTNRKCFMMELDPHYCDVIVARWEKYTGKKAELLNG
jgi:DNA modification methylase